MTADEKYEYYDHADLFIDRWESGRSKKIQKIQTLCLKNSLYYKKFKSVSSYLILDSTFYW